MKKFICAVLVAALPLLVCGCSTAEYTPSDITDALLESDAFSDPEKYISLNDEQMNGYFGYGEDMIDDFSILVSSAEEDSTELGVLELDDMEDLSTVVDGIHRHISSSTSNMLEFSNDSGKSVQSYLLMRLDDMVIYAVPHNAAAAEEVLSSMGATEIN